MTAKTPLSPFAPGPKNQLPIRGPRPQGVALQIRRRRRMPDSHCVCCAVCWVWPSLPCRPCAAGCPQTRRHRHSFFCRLKHWRDGDWDRGRGAIESIKTQKLRYNEWKLLEHCGSKLYLKCDSGLKWYKQPLVDAIWPRATSWGSNKCGKCHSPVHM